MNALIDQFYLIKNDILQDILQKENIKSKKRQKRIAETYREMEDQYEITHH